MKNMELIGVTYCAIVGYNPCIIDEGVSELEALDILLEYAAECGGDIRIDNMLEEIGYWN